MEKMNLPPFYIGQKVVYVGSGRTFPLNSIHTISDLKKDSCGCWSVEVDGKNIEFKNEYSRCKACGKVYTGFYYGYFTSAFRPVQEAKPPLIKLTLSKIKETEKEQILIEN
mgnify:CR=1 FL=1